MTADSIFLISLKLTFKCRIEICELGAHLDEIGSLQPRVLARVFSSELIMMADSI